MVTKKTEGEHSDPGHTQAVVTAVSEVIKNLDVQKDGELTINHNSNNNNSNNKNNDNNNDNTNSNVEFEG